MTTSACGDALSLAEMAIAALEDALPAAGMPRCGYAVQQHLGGKGQCFGGKYFGGRCHSQLAGECWLLVGAHLQFPPLSSLHQEWHLAADDGDSRQNLMAQNPEDDQLLLERYFRHFAELCSRSSYHAPLT